MKTHPHYLPIRMLKAGMRVHLSTYSHKPSFAVVAVGVDYRNRIISLATNTPRFHNRGRHAEERVIHNSPRSLVRILIARYGRRGDLLPIDPCEKCVRLADKFGVKIERIETR